MRIDEFFNIFGTTMGIIILILGFFLADLGLVTIPLSFAGFIGPAGVWLKHHLSKNNH